MLVYTFGLKNNLTISPKRDFMFRALFSKEDNVDLLENLTSSIIGIKEWQRQKSIDIARALLKNGISINIIINSTGLSKNEIDKLK